MLPQLTATLMAAAIRKAQRGATTRQLPLYWLPYRFLVFETCVFSEVLLRIVVVGFKKSILYKRAYKVHLGPLRPSLEESSCPKSCSSTRAAPRPWEQLLGSAPEETGNVC